MRARWTWGFWLSLSVLVAGCTSDKAPPPFDANDGDAIASPFDAVTVPAPSFDFASVVDPDHVLHELPMLHTTSHGLKLVGHTGVGDILPPGVRGSITQIDVWNGWAVVAGMEQGPAFVIVNITDPAAPKPVAWYPTVADGWTARFSHDGTFLFYGCQTLGPPNGVTGVVKGDCRDPNALYAQTSATAGISVFDVSDKARPRYLDFVPTSGSHNIQYAFINGTDYVVTSSTSILKFDRDAMRLSKIAQIPGVHDVQVSQHPVTKDWLLYTGGSEGGFAIFSINEPATPEVVLERGRWTSANGTGWHDQVAFPYLVDGRALVALSGETFASGGSLETGALAQGVPDVVTIVDVTDPANPQRLGQWVPPFGADLPWGSYTFSVHEMAATPQGQLAIAWYHGGVWVIDVSTKDRQAEPVTVAAFQPSKDVNVIPSAFSQTPLPLVPFVWSAAWDQRGYLVVPDMHTGVYVLEPEWGLNPMLDSGA